MIVPNKSDNSRMPRCCIENFVTKGLTDRLRLAKRGERFTCTTCNRTYELKGLLKPIWTLIVDGPKNWVN